MIAQNAEEPSGEQFFTEGEDTKCEVAYQPYSGSHEDLFLKEGDRIAVISPSSLPAREQTDAVINGLKAWGYEPVEGKYVCVETRTLAEVMEDLEWALEDPEIKAEQIHSRFIKHRRLQHRILILFLLCNCRSPYLSYFLGKVFLSIIIIMNRN